MKLITRTNQIYIKHAARSVSEYLTRILYECLTVPRIRENNFRHKYDGITESRPRIVYIAYKVHASVPLSRRDSKSHPCEHITLLT